VTPARAASPDAEFAKHYNSVMTRMIQVKGALAQRQRRRGAPAAELPADIRAARDRLDAQIQAVVTAMGARDNLAAEQHLHDADETLTVVEQFLAK
jgi:hypothetical protein